MSEWSARAWTLRQDGIAAHVAHLREVVPPAFTMICLREEVRLGLAAPSGTDITASLSGSLFGPNGEVKWRRDGDDVWCRLLAPTADVQMAPPSPVADLGGEVADAAPMLLWGSRQGDEWLDDRIPRPLQYQLDLAMDVHDEAAIRCRTFQPSDGSGALASWHSVVLVEGMERT